MNNVLDAIIWNRVSTREQGKSGLGLEDQSRVNRATCEANGWRIVHEYTESVHGDSDDDSPRLREMLDHAKRRGAIIVVSKLDRLSRDSEFLMGLERRGFKVEAGNVPSGSGLTFGIMSVIAQHERKTISDRTKAALAALKARGATLGCPKGCDRLGADRRALGAAASAKVLAGQAQGRAELYRGLVDRLADMSATQAAKELNSMGEPSPRGGKWQATQVIRLRQRLAA